VVIRRQPRAWRYAAAQSNDDGPAQVGMAVLDSADSFTAFERGFRHPLSTLAAAGELKRDLVVVIDGLDEVSSSGRGNDLTNLLAAQSHRPVPHLRLLMTTRPGPITDVMHATPNLRLDDDPSTVETIASVWRRYRRPSADPQTFKAEGSFVYAMLAAELRPDRATAACLTLVPARARRAG
jgi:hypothetical protein